MWQQCVERLVANSRLLGNYFAIAFLNSPALLLAIFVIGKTIAELKLRGWSPLQVTPHRSAE